MKTINIKKNYIPIRLADEENGKEIILKFYRTDENMKKLQDQQEEIKKMASATDDDDREQAKSILKSSLDTVFKEGTFDEIYEINPSISIIMEYFIQIVIYLLGEMDEAHNTVELEKYLN